MRIISFIEDQEIKSSPSPGFILYAPSPHPAILELPWISPHMLGQKFLDTQPPRTPYSGYTKASSYQYPILPQFDPATRTLKVRLEADNPGYVMRPDMFVNVELPVSGPPAMIVPMDAVLDSGLKKTVFVDRGNGLFEPRQVETGRLLGERLEITRGLMPGEKIVVSGNFLIDSEARMQQAGAGIAGKLGRDPVCGMNVDEDRSKAEGNVREYKTDGALLEPLQSASDYFPFDIIRSFIYSLLHGSSSLQKNFEKKLGYYGP